MSKIARTFERPVPTLNGEATLGAINEAIDIGRNYFAHHGILDEDQQVPTSQIWLIARGSSLIVRVVVDQEQS
jgi:hypothetical protein